MIAINARHGAAIEVAADVVGPVPPPVEVVVGEDVPVTPFVAPAVVVPVAVLVVPTLRDTLENTRQISDDVGNVPVLRINLQHNKG